MTIALTDPLAQIKTEYTYAPYGETTRTGEANANPFQYTGRENDGTGLYYYRARYYSPGLQRFVSWDPIGLAGGLNTYAYVEGNPVSFIDPLGLSPQQCTNDKDDKCKKVRGLKGWLQILVLVCELITGESGPKPPPDRIPEPQRREEPKDPPKRK